MEESQQDFKKLPPDWIYNFDDSKLNVKTLILDINRSVKKDQHTTSAKMTPVASYPKEVNNVVNEGAKAKEENSFTHTYANYVNEGQRLNMHAENLNKKNK